MDDTFLYSTEELSNKIRYINSKLDSINYVNIDTVVVLVIWIYELFLQIMISRYPKHKIGISSEQKIFYIDVYLVWDTIDKNEIGSRVSKGKRIITNMESVCNLRNHISHFNIGIEETILDSFVDVSSYMVEGIVNALAFNKNFEKEITDSFKQSFTGMMQRCYSVSTINNISVCNYFKLK